MVIELLIEFVVFEYANLGLRAYEFIYFENRYLFIKKLQKGCCVLIVFVVEP